MARGKQIIKKISKSTSECLELFIKHCEVKNLTFRTINNYRFECQHFIEWHGKKKELMILHLALLRNISVICKARKFHKLMLLQKYASYELFFTSVWNENT